MRIRNWKSHADTEMEFSEGTNVLIGENGSGKSSVLDAICFALFGTFPDLNEKKVKFSDIIRRYPNREREGEVVLAFKVNGKKYTVKRVFGEKGVSHSEIRENGVLLSAPKTSEVTSLVERITGLNYELYIRAVYAPQDRLNLLAGSPKDRKKRLDEIFGLDVLTRLRDNTSSLRLHVSRLLRMEEEGLGDGEELRKRETRLRKEVEEMEGVLKEEEGRLGAVEEEMARIRRKMEEMESAVEEYQGDRRKLEFVEREISRLRERVREVKESREELERKREEVERMREEVRYLREVERRYGILEERYRRNLEEMESLEVEEVEVDEGEVERVEREVGEARKKEEEVLRLEERKRMLEKEVERIEEVLREIGGVNPGEELERTKVLLEIYREAEKGVCPVCGSRISQDFREKIGALETRMEELRRLKEKYGEIDVRRLEERKRMLEKEVERIEEVLREIGGVKERVAALEERLRELRALMERKRAVERNLKRKRELEEENRKLVEEMRRLKEELEKRELPPEEEVERMYREVMEKLRSVEILESLNRLMAERERLREKIGELEPLVEKYRALKRELDELEKKKEGIYRRLAELREALAGKRAELSGVLRELEEWKKRAERVKRLREYHNLLSHLLLAVEEAQKEIRTEVLTYLNILLQKTWEGLFPYPTYPSIRLRPEKEDYVLELMDRRGNWVNALGVTSGGERTSALVALRLAISELLSNLGLLILDEPTHNMDANVTAEFAHILREGRIPQVILVSHKEELQNAASGKAYILKKVNGITRISSASS